MKYQFYAYLWLREDGTPYYVGKGSGIRAYKYHKCHGNPPPLGRIVFYITKDEAEAFEIEAVLIWYYGRKDLGTGCLRNLTNGGEGAHGHQVSPEARAVMGAAKLGNKIWLGRKHTPETLMKMQAIREARGTVVVSEETRQKISAAGKGRKFSAEHKAKLSASATGRKMTPEQNAKNSAARKGKPSVRKGAILSEETKEKIRLGHLGKPFHESPESKQKRAERALLKNHIRWHVNRNIVKDTCKLCSEGNNSDATKETN